MKRLRAAAAAILLLTSCTQDRPTSLSPTASSGPSMSETPGAPAAPSNLEARRVWNQIDLTWTDNSDNESSFKIERCLGDYTCTNFAEIASVGPDVISYSDKRLAYDTEYAYRVRASNSQGDSPYSNSAAALTGGRRRRRGRLRT